MVIGIAVVVALVAGALLALQPRTQAPATQAQASAQSGQTQATDESTADTPAVSSSRESEAGRVTPVEVQGDEVRLALADLSDGQAHYYSVQVGGKTVPFFVLKGSDGKIRAALDACVVCYGAKKGYRKDEDVMVFNNCGNRFPSVSINEITGGCNPVPLERQEQDGSLIISAAELAAGAEYF